MSNLVVLKNNNIFTDSLIAKGVSIIDTLGRIQENTIRLRKGEV
jgi:hypothetical protein